MQTNPLPLFIAVIAFVLAPLQASGSAVEDRVNVLLIVSEDNGAELSCYGDPFVKTPNLDQLAAEGARFSNAYVTHAVCSVSRASILTGLYPFQNGQIGLATHQYSMFRAWDNIPSLLKQFGYRTGIIGKLHVNPVSAFPFDTVWRDPKAVSFNKRDVAQVAEQAGQFFRESGDTPFFLAVNYPDAHFPLLRQQHGLPERPITAAEVKTLPFIGADTPRLRQGTADYYNCLMRLDTGVGMLLEQLQRYGLSDRTLVIYLGDHGAQFSRGKGTCYEGGLRIPLIVRWPGQVKPGVVRDELVSTVDILPTILQAVSLPSRASLPGRSILPLAAGRSVPWRSHLFAERTAFHAGSYFPQRTFRNHRFKVIRNLDPNRVNPVADRYADHEGAFFIYGTTRKEIAGTPEKVRQAYQTWRNPPAIELYDLENDPWEFQNLADQAQFASVQQELLEGLEQFRKRHRDPLLDSFNRRQLAREHEHVDKNLPRGRYPAGRKWNYLTYLQAIPPTRNATPNSQPASDPATPRVTPVFTPAADGYPHIRIPSLVVTRSGTVLAFAEGRQGGDHSENDIILRRSSDDGETWGKLQIVHEDGRNVLVNPCAVSLVKGRVLLMFQRFPAGYHARAIPRHGIKLLNAGTAGGKISRTLIMHSDDDGQSWSQPRDVTVQTKRPTMIATATGPGIGIQLQRGPHAGRILMPTNESSELSKTDDFGEKQSQTQFRRIGRERR